MIRNYDSSRCTGCSLCTLHCPQKILYVSPEKFNEFGKHTICINSEEKCLNCRICAEVCPYLAITFKSDTEISSFPRLMKDIKIPFHNGCSQGIIERLLAEVVEELNIENEFVLFKSETARFQIIGDVRGEYDYFNKALEYKKNHPKKIVMIWYTNEEPCQNEQALEHFKKLTDSNVVLFHMLNYFSELRNNPGTDECAYHICEGFIGCENVSYVARAGFSDRNMIKDTKMKIIRAIKSQITFNKFSFLEFIFPCHWRLEGRPEQDYSPDCVLSNVKWFDSVIHKLYPIRIFVDKSI